MAIKVTKHTKQHIKERMVISKVSLEIAEKTLLFGITHAETKGSLHKYFDG